MTTQALERFLIDTHQFDGTHFYEITPDDRVAYSGYLYNNKGPNLTVDEYIAHTETRTFVSPTVLTWEELVPLIDEAHKRLYTSKSPQSLSLSQYNELFETLPPMEAGFRDGMEYFLFAERLTDTITAMYACKGKQCLTKHVDINDRSTWITSADFGKCIIAA